MSQHQKSLGSPAYAQSYLLLHRFERDDHRELNCHRWQCVAQKFPTGLTTSWPFSIASEVQVPRFDPRVCISHM